MSKRIFKYEVPLDLVETTCVVLDGKTFRGVARGDRATVEGPDESLPVSAPWRIGRQIVELRLTPGAENYRASLDDLVDRHLMGAALLTAIVGHPDAGDDANGTALAAVWSHHLALARQDEPRRVATIYAPTETKTIAWRVQHAAALGVEIVECLGS